MRRFESPAPSVPARTVAAIGLFAALLVACDAGFTSPFASFDARCAKLAPTRFNVVVVPLTYAVDTSKTIDELTVMGGNTPATHATFGLTTVRFGHETDTAVKVVEDSAGTRACASAEVNVALSMQPVLVHVARELVRTPCAHDATLSHELKHVASFRAVLDEAKRDLDADLADAIGIDRRFGKDGPSLKTAINAQVQAYLSVFVKQWHKEMMSRQGNVDTEEEYRRVATSCPR